MKRFSYLLLLIIGALAIGLHSCTDDFFDDPNTDPVDKFLGNWVVNETSLLFGQSTYNVTIERNPDNTSEVIIKNFYHEGYSEFAKALVTSNTLTVYQQTICENSKTISGTGTFSGGTINFTYTVNDGADLDNVTAVYTKN